jgi:hypothetical protein
MLGECSLNVHLAGAVQPTVHGGDALERHHLRE